MGSVTGVSPYEYKRSKAVAVEKAVATEVLAVTTEEVKKTVAEELKVKDPENAAEIVEVHKGNIDQPQPDNEV